MKTKIAFVLLCLLVSLVVPYISSAEPQYKFSKEAPLLYNFMIEGDVTYKYEGASEEKFNVSSKGTITLETVEVKDGKYILKLTPSKTVIKVGDTLLEDLTDSETAISRVISTSLVEIKSNGEVVSVKEISPGILDISQILMILPAFPEKLTRPWKQTVPAFSIPGIPMCSLTFTYTYSQAKDGISKVQLLSNQAIKEERKEKDVIISFTGRNASNGEFLFDEGKGKLKSFDGIIDLLLNIVFKVPSSPERKTSGSQSVPLKIGLKLKISITQR